MKMIVSLTTLELNSRSSPSTLLLLQHSQPQSCHIIAQAENLKTTLDSFLSLIPTLALSANYISCLTISPLSMFKEPTSLA